MRTDGITSSRSRAASAADSCQPASARSVWSTSASTARRSAAPANAPSAAAPASVTADDPAPPAVLTDPTLTMAPASVCPVTGDRQTLSASWRAPGTSETARSIAASCDSHRRRAARHADCCCRWRELAPLLGSQRFQQNGSRIEYVDGSTSLPVKALQGCTPSSRSTLAPVAARQFKRCFCMRNHWVSPETR